MRVTITASALLAVNALAFDFFSHTDLDWLLFNNWAATYGKNYRDLADYKDRVATFMQTVEDISLVNNTPGETVHLDHNRFSDWAPSEFHAMIGSNPEDMAINQEPTILDASKNSDSIDWIEKGAVNEVQDQQACSSPYAFSAIAAIEGRHFVQSGELLKFSEQQCIDCDRYS